MSEPQKATQIRSAINQMSALRVSQRFGPHVLKLFLDMESAMREGGGTSFTGNVSFMEPGDPVQDGELIPTIHFSLQPHYSVLSVPIDIQDEEEDGNDRADSPIRDGATGEE